MNQVDLLRALSFLVRGTPLRSQITDNNRTFKTQPDPERLVAAEAKRARKDAKRAKEFHS